MKGEREMFNNKKYNWDNKFNRAKTAQDHTRLMEQQYKKEIEQSVISTYMFSDTEFIPNRLRKNPEIIVNNLDSVSSVLESHPGRKCVLNFASFKEPGGMFIQGSRAQEECLCHESFLYNVLRTRQSFYNENKKMLNRSLYQNRALYSCNIIFYREKKAEWCDVLTCAAPNYAAARAHCHVTAEENSKVLRDRIRFVLDIAEHMQVDTLILGAYGAGVFGQDATEVANIFKELLETGYYGFTRVVFSVIQNGDGNYEKFEKILGM